MARRKSRTSRRGKRSMIRSQTRRTRVNKKVNRGGKLSQNNKRVRRSLRKKRSKRNRRNSNKIGGGPDELKQKLIDKGFNLQIDGIDVIHLDPRTIELGKNAQNDDGVDIPMTIELKINNWGGEKQYEFLRINDFFIIGVRNGTQEQHAAGIDTNQGKGIFTRFLKEVVGHMGSFHVFKPTLYWGKIFDLKSENKQISTYSQKKVEKQYLGDEGGVTWVEEGDEPSEVAEADKLQVADPWAGLTAADIIAQRHALPLRKWASLNAKD